LCPPVEYCSTLDTCIHLYPLVSQGVNANWIQVDTCRPFSELKSATCVPCCGRFRNQSRTQHDRGRRRFLRATNATTTGDTAQTKLSSSSVSILSWLWNAKIISICHLAHGTYEYELRTLTLFSRSHHSLTLNISQTASDTAIVTIEDE